MSNTILQGISEPGRAEVLREYQRRVDDQNAELNKLWQAIEQSANIVVITDLEGRIEYVKPKFVEVTGYTTDEALGQNLSLLKSGEQDRTFDFTLPALSRG